VSVTGSSVASPIAASVDGDQRPLAAQRGDEALAARQVAERARADEVAVVGDAGSGRAGRASCPSRAGT
jgi:hypothetical protein